MSRNESCMNILTDSLDTHVVHPCAGVNGYRGSIEFLGSKHSFFIRVIVASRLLTVNSSC
jgi:hypothetical protein